MIFDMEEYMDGQSLSKPAASQRIEYVDIAKGIGILLVWFVISVINTQYCGILSLYFTYRYFIFFLD